MDKDERRARQKLSGIGQEHVFKYWNELDGAQRKSLLGQIEGLDVPGFRWQQDVLGKRQAPSPEKIRALEDVDVWGEPDKILAGRRLLGEGKVGCLIVAGGQGTRLRMEGPKGTYPITAVNKKSLFQLFAEKALAAGKQAGKMLQLAVMTSPQNHRETLQFFKDHRLFGLSPLQISFFCQGTLPLLDDGGDLFLEGKGALSIGSDGNGSSLRAFVESGIWEKWKGKGIAFVNYVPIDNPLADPFDANLVGVHASRHNGVTVKCVEREDPEESVGVLVVKDGRLGVVEYTEISQEERRARSAEGALIHACANISLFCFGMDFIQAAASKTGEMPLHLARKAAKRLNADGIQDTPSTPNAWKFERFIFDVLPWADNASALVYPRERCFAPLKNFEGKDSPQTVQDALQNLDRYVLEELTGEPAPAGPLELSQEFHYPMPERPLS